MAKNNVKRYIWIMSIGVLLNLGLYEIAHVFKLPVWLDAVGTAYTAFLLEPAAGLLVAFATNFYQAAVIYDSSSLIYYMVSAVAALVFGIGLRKKGEIKLSRIPLTVICYILAGTLAAGTLTLWRNAGIPDSGWERHFYEMALSAGIPNAVSCYFGTFVLKVFDGIILGIAMMVLYMVTPKKWITLKAKEIVSWSVPFFQ